MINERGTKKWTSLMLPEHIQMLEDIEKEQDRKEKPIVDDHQKEEINRALKMAIKQNLNIRITRYMSGSFYESGGKIKVVDSTNDYLWLNDEKIKIDNIVKAYIL